MVYKQYHFSFATSVDGATAICSCRGAQFIPLVIICKIWSWFQMSEIHRIKDSFAKGFYYKQSCSIYKHASGNWQFGNKSN